MMIIMMKATMMANTSQGAGALPCLLHHHSGSSLSLFFILFETQEHNIDLVTARVAEVGSPGCYKIYFVGNLSSVVIYLLFEKPVWAFNAIQPAFVQLS